MPYISEGSELERVIADGRDRVLDYVNRGNIPEMNAVIPSIDHSECIRRLKAQSLIKARGRQVCNGPKYISYFKGALVIG